MPLLFNSAPTQVLIWGVVTIIHFPFGEKAMDFPVLLLLFSV